MEIIGYEDYLIYDDARVYSKKSNIFMKPATFRHGYKLIGLSKNGKQKFCLIHRLVALHYIPNPENKLEVDHISRDPSNNHVSNLRWSTHSENCQNKGMPNTNTSGVKNVYYHKQRDKWVYTKTINKIKHQKYFNTFDEAVEYKNNHLK